MLPDLSASGHRGGVASPSPRPASLCPCSAPWLTSPGGQAGIKPVVQAMKHMATLGQTRQASERVWPDDSALPWDSCWVQGNWKPVHLRSAPSNSPAFQSAAHPPPWVTRESQEQSCPCGSQESFSHRGCDPRAKIVYRRG